MKKSSQTALTKFESFIILTTVFHVNIVYTLYDFDLTPAIIYQNQCKLAKVLVSSHDFQCFRQTAYMYVFSAIL
jgi:hypothetical protein